MSNDHRKHAKLPRPSGGDWGRSEFALLGAPCSVLEDVTARLIRQFPNRKFGVATATHHQMPVAQPEAVGYLQTEDTAAVRFSHTPHCFTQQVLFQDCDIVLVNGNHFQARQQVAFLHPAKSLAKHPDRLTDVRLVVVSGDTPVPEALHPVLSSVPRVSLEDTGALFAAFEQLFAQAIPPLNGLVLAGGQSLRMGQDKSLLQYHQKPQRTHVYEMLQPWCDAVFVSCNATQAATLDLPKIEDRFLGIGPVGGILSAFQSAPDAAWLTLAADLPYLRSETLGFLLAHRNPSKLATAFAGSDGLPEPLITIWEPRAYPVLLQALGRGITCPRKVLLSCGIELLQPPAAAELQNINDPEARATALAALQVPTPHPAA